MDPPSMCLELAEFGHYLADLLLANDLDDAFAGLALLERLLTEGSPKVRDAASTCALESLDSHGAEAGLDPHAWGALLPPAAKAFLTDWHGDAGRYEPPG